ncbi:hypothetical protein BYT27DRAFT_6953579 [Phlegmacium glaucopus]|nr:hypothetical protein BYT27DRAFT_6953579 [Phlegmacium glaucopus]
MLAFPVLLFLLLTISRLVIGQTSNATGLPVGSCTATIPCANGACCNSVSGFCGFGPNFCTTLANGGPCSSHCDALADCGPFAAAENFTCPLNVCCSQFGFCGTTEEFCGAGCQSFCTPPSQESCGDNQASATHRRIGYYEAWAVQSSSRACDVYPPELISAETLTHINFAFALISEDFLLQEMSVGDNVLWMRTTALKSKNPALKVFLSVGGWSFNDPPTQNIFSNLVGSLTATNTFISNALQVMQAYSFDGLDIDWEYPVAPERGGAPEDKANYPIFMSRVKAAFSSRGYGLTFTAPSSYWYLQHFDLPSLLQSADWVNIMTYDLHGTWDSTDPFIGPFVAAHTNLTEIMSTMQLFRNVGVNPSQMVMGIGFYGRSFTLVDGQCNTPGCAFSGGGDPGECSLSSGTLMYSEILKLLDTTSNLVPVFDEAAAIKYITWNNNQWVSYDDAQTLQMKMDYANSICLGGTMIWSVDQDDSSYSALSGLYPDININNPSVIESGNQCQVTGCGQQCPSGYDSLTTLTQIPNTLGSCPTSNPARLCCPKGNEPQNCSWRGGGGTSCNAQCNVGEIVLALDETGDDGHPTCIQGYKAFCCSSGDPEPGACFGGSCSANECASPYVVQTFVKQGSADNGLSCESVPNAVCPTVCQSNTKPVCCNSGYTNCRWVGDPPACLNAVCSAGQIAIFSDMQGDASSTCVGNNKRFYCCDPPTGSSFLPIPVTDVFPATGNGFNVDQPATFTVDFDDNTGTSDTSTTGAGSSGIGDDGEENDSAFGEIFISSPNPGSVSSMDLASDWVITSCSATSDQAQNVLAYCSKGMDDDDSGCSHVFIGQAAHTIVRLPKSCGLGPYARVVALTEHPDQNVLPQEHLVRKRSTEKVYSFLFDYNFAAIPSENGPVLMRADATNLPGYWDAIIDSPPDSGTTTTRRRRDFHQPIEYEKRWFGPFDSWLAKLTTVRTGDTVTRNYHWSDTYTIFHAEQQCPHFSSSLDISVTGTAQVSSQFGYYLEATIVPPAIQQAYVFFDAGAGAQASFTITGLAEAHYSSGRQELATFGFPGLYYPGLLTIGPSLHLYGELSGQLSLSGRFTASIGYDFPPISYAFGLADGNPDEEQPSSDVDPNNNNAGYDFSIGYNVNLEGSLDAHIIPSLQLGISVLGGSLVDAEVFAEADMFVGVTISGSVNQASAPQFCVNPHYGVNLNAGLTGAVLFWRPNPIVTNFYSADFPFGGSCFNSVTQGSASGNSRRSSEPLYVYQAHGSGREGSDISLTHDLNIPAYAAVKKGSQSSRKSALAWSPSDTLLIGQPTTSWTINNADHNSTFDRRAIPFLPGYLVCPTVDNEITGSTGASDCMCYSDNNIDAQGATGQYIDILARGFVDIPANLSAFYDDEIPLEYDNVTADIHEGFGSLHRRASGTATLRTCSAYSLDMSGYSSTQIGTFFDVGSPNTLNPTFGTYNPYPPNVFPDANGNPILTTEETGGSIFAREHVYELQVSGSPSWCTWVNQNLRQGANSVFEQIQNCYPGGSNGANSMVMLEQQANVFKNYAFYDTERQLVPGGGASIQLVDETKFKNMCPTKQVARLRAAAGLPSYLNNFSVRQNFLRDNTCIRNIWIAWYNGYLQLNPARGPNPGNVNVPNIYDNFVHNIIKGVVPYLQTQIPNYIALYNPGQNADSTQDVRVSFAVELDYWTAFENGDQNAPWDNNAAPKADLQVSRTQLTQQILNAIPSITWLNVLPTH